MEVAKAAALTASDANSEMSKAAQLMQHGVKTDGEKAYEEGEKKEKDKRNKARVEEKKKEDTTKLENKKAVDKVKKQANADTEKVVKQWADADKAAAAKKKGSDKEDADGKEGGKEEAGKKKADDGKEAGKEEAGKEKADDGKEPEKEADKEEADKEEASNESPKKDPTATDPAKKESTAQLMKKAKDLKPKVTVDQEIEKEKGRVAALSKKATHSKGEKDKDAVLKRLRIAKAKESTAEEDKLVAQQHARTAALKASAKGAIQAEEDVSFLKQQIVRKKKKSQPILKKKLALEAVNVADKKAFTNALRKWQSLESDVPPSDPASEAYKNAMTFLAKRQESAKRSLNIAREAYQKSTKKLASVWKQMSEGETKLAKETAKHYQELKQDEAEDETVLAKDKEQNKTPAESMQHHYGAFPCPFPCALHLAPRASCLMACVFSLFV